MRRAVLVLLVLVLGAVMAARAQLPTAEEKAAAMAASWDSGRYNVLVLDGPRTADTAGSSLITQIDSYFLTRTPTAKGRYTGLLAGKDLVLLLAEEWVPESVNRVQTPGLYKLLSEGAQVDDVYAPVWYQGRDGREFALLSGLVPTMVQSRTAMAWAGQQGTRLPYALGQCLGAAGYICRACGGDVDRAAAYGALGFDMADGDLAETVADLAGGEDPFAVYQYLQGQDGEAVLARLWETLERQDAAGDTVVAVLTGSPEPLRGRLFLWGDGLTGAHVTAPCSELDVTPTLLDLLGAAYDARFLSGRDLLSADGEGRPVALYGSAYSDWATDAGCYTAGTGTFDPADERFSTDTEAARYVRRMCQTVYDGYIYARRVMETDYFRAAEK